MLNLPASIRIFAARRAVDFRKAHDGLLAVIRDAFGDDPFEGSLFVFAFGRGSEKRGKRELPADAVGARQDHLWLTQLVEEADRTGAKTGAHGSIEITPPKQPVRKPGKRRQKLPSHLPKVRTTYELPAEQCVCTCGGALHEIGEDVTSELLRVELTLVHEITRKRYGCPRGRCRALQVDRGWPVLGNGRLKRDPQPVEGEPLDRRR